MAALAGGKFADVFAETGVVDPAYVSAEFPTFHFPAPVVLGDVGTAAPADTQGSWSIAG